MLDTRDLCFVAFYQHLFTILNNAWPNPAAIYFALQTAWRIDTMDLFLVQEDELHDCVSIFTAIEGMVFVRGSHAILKKTIHWLYDTCCGPSKDAFDARLATLVGSHEPEMVNTLKESKDSMHDLITSLYKRCTNATPSEGTRPENLYDQRWLTLAAGLDTGSWMMQYYLLTLLPMWTPEEARRILVSARLAPTDPVLLSEP